MKITNQELLEVSLKIELDRKRFHSELAEKVTDSKMNEFSQLMAREEALNDNQFKHLIE